MRDVTEERTPERGAGGASHRATTGLAGGAGGSSAPTTPTERKRRRKNIADDVTPSGKFISNDFSLIYNLTHLILKLLFAGKQSRSDNKKISEYFKGHPPPNSPGRGQSGTKSPSPIQQQLQQPLQQQSTPAQSFMGVPNASPSPQGVTATTAAATTTTSTPPSYSGSIHSTPTSNRLFDCLIPKVIVTNPRLNLICFRFQPEMV